MGMRKNISKDIKTEPSRQGRGALRSGYAHIEHIYQQYWGDVRDYVLARFGSGPPDPEDIAQQVFARLSELKQLDRLDNQKSFLMTLAHNMTIDAIRRQKTHANAQNNLGNTAENVDDLTPERVYMAKEEVSNLKHALSTLPEKRRELLLMHRVQGLSFVEIAKRTGLSQSTVKYHVAQGFAECMEAMKAIKPTSQAVQELGTDHGKE